MFGLLVKKQMIEIFRAYFYDAKKNKKRSKISTFLFIAMYALIMVGVLGGMFGYVGAQLCKPFCMVKMEWLYFLIMSMIAIALGAFGSVFNTFSGLYMSKDNDLLLSLPIPVKCILASRLMSVYLMGLMYSAVVIVPAVIVYWAVADITILSVIGTIMLILIISVIVLILSCVLGWCVANISQKLKNRSFITVFIALLFFAAYYFVYFKAQQAIQGLVENAAIYGRKVKDSAYLIYVFGKIGEGDIAAMAGYTLVTAILCAITFIVLEKSFLKIVTSSGNTKRIVYKEKKYKQKSAFNAFVSKEFARFTSSPNYILNCGLGTLFLVIIGFVIAIKGNEFSDIIDSIPEFGDKPGFVLICTVSVICLTAAMNDMIVPSVSLEGKSLWIAQSLPVKTWDVLKAKLAVQLSLTLIPIVFCDICMAVVWNSSGAVLVLAMLIPIVFSIFMAFMGLVLAVKRPNLTWTSELAPIKQSLSVFIEMFTGWVIAAAFGGIYIFTDIEINVAVYMLGCIAVLSVLSVVLYIWLKKKASSIYRSL